MTTPTSPFAHQTRRGAGTAPALLAALAVAALLAGCGGGSGDPDKERVRAVVTAFVNSANERDFGAVCSLLTQEARKAEVGVAKAGKCAEALAGTAGLEEPGDVEVDVRDVRISGDRAAVEVRVRNPDEETTEQSLQLVRAEDGWLISEIE